MPKVYVNNNNNNKIMDEDFPVFIPISDCPQGTLSKLRHADNRIAAAEEKCETGDESVLQIFEHLVQQGTDAREIYKLLRGSRYCGERIDSAETRYCLLVCHL